MMRPTFVITKMVEDKTIAINGKHSDGLPEKQTLI